MTTHIEMTVRLVHDDSREEDVEILVPKGPRGLTLPPEVLIRDRTAYVLDVSVPSPVATCACKRVATVLYLYRQYETLVVQDDVLRLVEGLTFDRVEHGDSERADAWREYRDALCAYTWDALRGGHK